MYQSSDECSGPPPAARTRRRVLERGARLRDEIVALEAQVGGIPPDLPAIASTSPRARQPFA
jgi:hypothetical protein